MNRYINVLFAVLFAGLVLGSCDNKDLSITLPEPTPLDFPEIKEPGRLINPLAPSALETVIYGAHELDLKIEKPFESSDVVVMELTDEERNALVSKYSEFVSDGNTYRLLNSDLAVISKNNDMLHIAVADPSSLNYGDYLLPLAVSVDGQVSYHFIHYAKDGDFTPLTDKLRKPLPPHTLGGPVREEPMRMIAYVETNDWDPRNMGNFILEKTKQPIFDYVILFAANMNFNAITGKRYISFNKELTPIVNNPDIYIRPLQDRGIKVLIDILPNHQGVGYANFQSYEEALEFAQEAKEWTDKLGIDGWDVDEEYADYSKLWQSHPSKPESWMWYAKAMKTVMPDKLLTLYDFGHSYSSYRADSDDKYPKDYFDLSWANYGEDHGSRAGLSNDRYGKLSIEASRGALNETTLRNSANANIRDGYGNLMVFNIRGVDIKNGTAEDALSAATEILYGQKTVFAGKYYNGPSDN